MAGEEPEPKRTISIVTDGYHENNIDDKEETQLEKVVTEM